MTAHVIHWLSVAASVAFALCELCAGDFRGFANAAGALLGAGVVAHLKAFATQAAPCAKAAADALHRADGDPLTADTQEMPAMQPGPRLAPDTHPDDPKPA